MTRIKIGDPQPLPCDRCKHSYGYQYSDFMRLHYTSVHNSEGAYEGGQYSDHVTMIHKAIVPYCANCGAKLKFKLTRTSFESV